jgi:hypothetical protein
MSYDLTFFRPLPGQTAEETLDLICERPEGEEAPEARRLPKRAIADALLAEIEGLREQSTSFGIALEPQDASGAVFQYLISVDQVGLSFPYWEMTPERTADMRTKWLKTMRIFDTFGLTGWDPQLGCVPTAETIDEVLGIAGEVRQAIKKPWWKFW